MNKVTFGIILLGFVSGSAFAANPWDTATAAATGPSKESTAKMGKITSRITSVQEERVKKPIPTPNLPLPLGNIESKWSSFLSGAPIEATSTSTITPADATTPSSTTGTTTGTTGTTGTTSTTTDPNAAW